MKCGWCDKENNKDGGMKIYIKSEDVTSFNPESLTIYICKECSKKVSLDDAVTKREGKEGLVLVAL